MVTIYRIVLVMKVLVPFVERFSRVVKSIVVRREIVEASTQEGSGATPREDQDACAYKD